MPWDLLIWSTLPPPLGLEDGGIHCFLLSFIPLFGQVVCCKSGVLVVDSLYLLIGISSMGVVTVHFPQLADKSLDGCPVGSPAQFLWSSSIPLSWMAIILLLLCCLFAWVIGCFLFCSTGTMCFWGPGAKPQAACLGWHWNGKVGIVRIVCRTLLRCIFEIVPNMVWVDTGSWAIASLILLASLHSSFHRGLWCLPGSLDLQLF